MSPGPKLSIGCPRTLKIRLIDPLLMKYVLYGTVTKQNSSKSSSTDWTPDGENREKKVGSDGYRVQTPDLRVRS